MKLARLVCAALALPLVAGFATVSSACDDGKTTKASAAVAPASSKKTATAANASGTTCSAAMAAQCTPEMAAACKASMAAGGPDLCTGQKASATAAVAASNAGDACCMGGKATAVAASGHGSCAAKGAKGASASATCNGHGMASMAAASTHIDCDACADMADCNGALEAAGAHRQTVRLKNGIMYVYTADSPRSVNAVQAAVARRMDRMSRLASAGDKAHLCDECKSMRGAMASGKLNREVVNIEGGSLTLVTSSDPAVVAKLHAMAEDTKVATRVKL